jgi:tetratricopeptide (TPR) repeat protein
MDETNETLRRALSMAPADPRGALALLESGLEQARQQGDRRGLAALAKHAGVVSSGSGDLRGAIRYFDEALGAQPEDAYLHFARGDAHRALGQHEPARAAFTRSLELATSQGDLDMIEMASKACDGLDAPRSNDHG